MGFLSFIGDALNDILGGNSSRRDSQRYNLQNMEIQQGYNLQNMELQNQYNIEAFQRENDYNSPLAQQERLRRAGLNVNWSDAGSAIAQQDSGVSSSTPSGGMPSGQNAGGLSDLISLGSAIKDLKVKQSEIDVNNSQIGLNNAKAVEAYANAGKTDEEAVNVGPNSRVSRQTQISEQYRNQSQAALFDAQTEAQNKANKYIDSEKDSLIKQIMSEFNLNEAKARDIVDSFALRMKNLTQSTLESVSRTFKNYQDVEYNRQYLNILNKQISLGYANLSELRRHNISLEELQKQSSYIQSNYVKAQSEYLRSQGKYTDSLCTGQDIKNKIWDMDMALRRYARENKIDSRTLDLQLNALHNQAAMLEEQVKTQKLTQEYVDQQLMLAPINAVTGGISNLGQGWSKFTAP